MWAENVVKDVSFHVNKYSYGFKFALFNSLSCYNQVKLNLLQQTNCVVNDIDMLIDRCSYGHKAA